MVYAFQQDVPISMDIYRQIVADLGDEPPEGLIAHLAIERDGGLRYIDVWESREQHERFVEERLHPVVHRMLLSVGFDPLPPEPEQVPLEVRDVWGQPLGAYRPLAAGAG